MQTEGTAAPLNKFGVNSNKPESVLDMLRNEVKQVKGLLCYTNMTSADIKPTQV